MKLLEVSARYHPGVLAGLLTRRVFTYANVPYRIKPYATMLEDPRNTIEFDAALEPRSAGVPRPWVLTARPSRDPTVRLTA